MACGRPRVAVTYGQEVAVPSVPDLHPNALRAQVALAAAGCDRQVRQFAESTRTSAEAAAVLGVQVGQIAKSVVFLADGRPVVVVMSGSDRVDTGSLAAAIGAREVRKPSAQAVKEATGYPIGGVSPAGLPATVKVLVDKGMSRFEQIWAAAGTPYAVYPTNFPELLQVTGGHSVDVAERRPLPASGAAQLTEALEGAQRDAPGTHHGT